MSKIIDFKTKKAFDPQKQNKDAIRLLELSIKENPKNIMILSWDNIRNGFDIKVSDEASVFEIISILEIAKDSITNGISVEYKK
jgi:hypothetical protein